LSRVPGIGRGPPTAGTLLSGVITKPRIIGLLTILVVCFLILRPGDESCDSDNRKNNAGSTNDRRLQPRISTSPTPSHNHGIVGWPGAQNTPPLYEGVLQKPLSRRGRARPERSEGAWGEGSKGRRPVPFATPSYDRRGFRPEQPYPGLDYGGYGSPDPYSDPYGARTRTHTDGYRFRPLAEQALQHRQAPDPDRHQNRHAMPPDPSSRYRSPSPEQPQPTPPAPYPSQPAYADHPWEVYSFRPLEKSPGARGRWQGPYGQPDRYSDPYLPDPWSPSPPPQWGSTPPAQRMYPSLSHDPGRRLSAR